MEESYGMTHINNNLTGPFTIFSTVRGSVNYTIKNIGIENKEKIVKRYESEKFN